MEPFARALISALGLALAATPGAPAAAKVTTVASNGFVVRHLEEVPATADETWAMLLKPAEWWDSDHTWSGDAANLSIDPHAGGCFCEILPSPDSPRAAPRGSVEHMRVVYIERPRVLRMRGALGPLQADALNGTLTIQLKPVNEGKSTQILLEYVVGGYARTPYEKLATAVDGVLGQQMQHLVAKLGGAFAAAFPMPGSAGQGGAERTGTPQEHALKTEILPLSEKPPEADKEEIIGR
ncbi:MAG: SRPBCC family protein [Novosphingobium sp.]